MATTVYSLHFAPIVLKIESSHLVDDAPGPGLGSLPADLRRQVWVPTATVTIAPGANTLVGAADATFAAWKAANPNHDLLKRKILF